MAVADPVKYQRLHAYYLAEGLPDPWAQTMAERQVNDAVKLHAYDHNLYMHLHGEITTAEYVMNSDFLAGAGTKQMAADAGQFVGNPNSPYAPPVTKTAELYGPWAPGALEHLTNLYG